MARIEPAFIVKVCGITEETDARAALDAGANAVGFNFYPKSSRYISPERAREIVQALDGQFLRVGVFVNASAEQLIAVAETVPLDVLQLHGDDCSIPEGTGYRIWRSIRGDGPAPEADERVEAYLLDAHSSAYGGSGRTFDWSRARKFPFRAIVAGGLDGSNVAGAIASLHPWGVDACSRIERAPGKKDAARTRDFVRAALEGSELFSL